MKHKKFNLNGFSIMLLSFNLNLMKQRLENEDLKPIARFNLIERIEATQKYLDALNRLK